MGNGESSGSGKADPESKQQGASAAGNQEGVIIVDASTATEQYGNTMAVKKPDKMSLFSDEFQYFEVFDLASKSKTYVLGRQQECDVCIKSKELSRKHAQLSWDGGAEAWSIHVLSQFGASIIFGGTTSEVKVAQGEDQPLSGPPYGLVKLSNSIVSFAPNPINAQLLVEITSGPLEGRKWATGVKCVAFDIGRGSKSEIRFPASCSSVSSMHLHFEKDVHVGWTVCDTSTYGTTVCGWKLPEKKRIMCMPGLKFVIGLENDASTIVVSHKL